MSSSSTSKKKGGGQQPEPLRILCFGDSLTAGFPCNNPYAGKMARVIEKAYPGLKVDFFVDGQPGDLVTRGGDFVRRMERDWTPNHKPFDWTVILGGTNDIAWGRKADVVTEALQRVWKIPRNKVLALTIPETMGQYQDITETRNAVNKFIKEHREENFFHFDLHTELPYHNMNPYDRSLYWDRDGLHLKAAGYDLMGEKIGNALVRIMRLAEAQGTDIRNLEPKTRKAIEDMIYEEERGDPRYLSQGYIVVHKKDLD
ncbi:GDSL-like Lipase/Acylhydrolase [Poronia punctata]|nr:GDSL-like Lipase/Acylhydrolase [Poronia punctata]